VTPVKESFLFCITGGTTDFELMSESESQKIFESLGGNSRSLQDMVPTGSDNSQVPGSKG
jgi:hypothetical protein